ncbi:hypothetical protein DYD21_13505 [Rhodohalobacter sp. SW132]|nr:hypothetical protein DYD21_13505 [Rhodohalobacter sp. SW132]
MNHLATFKQIWQFSMLSFIIAALTGFLYRYGMLYPLPEWINFANIRHAHSHLMFFNWICPPIMIWMISKVITSEQTAEIAGFKRCLYTMIVLGFLSWPLFLLYGYHSVAIGSASLPLAAIVSGLVMITWYWFAWLWYRLRKNTDSSLSLLFYDAAIAALLISSLGAWGVSIFQFTPVDSPQISSAMTHFFLAVFTEGWAVLGVLGIIWHKADAVQIPIKTAWLWQPILFGSMLIFPFSLNQSMITPTMHYTAIAGALLIAGSFGLNLFLLLKSGALKGLIWKTIFCLMAVKILLQTATILPLDIWPGEHGLRVLYLHIFLLGIISILFFEVFYPNTFPSSKKLFGATVLLVLISLTMISGYWPVRWTPTNFYFWVMMIALLPALPALWIFSRDVLANRSD